MLTKSVLFSSEIEFLKLYEKVIVSNQYAILVNELDGVAFEEILKQKYQFSEVAGKILPDPGGRPGGRLGSRPPPQVDWGVDPRVDLGVDLPGRAQVTWVHQLGFWAVSGGL